MYGRFWYSLSWRPSWLILVAMVLVSIPQAIAAAELTPDELLTRLRSLDATLLDSFALTYDLTRPVPGRYVIKSHRIAQAGALTSLGDSWAAKIQNVEFRPVQQQEAYAGGVAQQPEGRGAEVRIPTLTYALAEPDFRARQLHWESREATSPDQTKSLHAPQIVQERPESAFSTPEVYIPLLASGRGYSRFITDIEKVETRDDGLLTVIASGRLGQSALRWEIVLDPEVMYLARSAVLRFARTGQIVEEFRTEGIMEGSDLMIAEVGHCAFGTGLADAGDGEWIIRFGSATITANHELLEEVRTTLRGELPPLASYLDRTGDRPKYRIVSQKRDAGILNQVLDESVENISSEPSSVEAATTASTLDQRHPQHRLGAAKIPSRWWLLPWILAAVALLMLTIAVAKVIRRHRVAK